MIKNINPKIEYKIVTGKDIIRLYNILLTESEKNEEISLEKDGIKYGDMELALRYHTKKIPDFKIKISDERSIIGTEITELQDFINNQKQPIISVSMSYFNNNSEYINLLISQSGTYFSTSSIAIVGSPDWAESMNGKICDVINNMHKIPSFYKYYIKNSALSFTILILFLVVSITILFSMLSILSNQKYASLISSLILAFSIDKIILTSFSILEFRLNPEYTDNVKRNRKKLSLIYFVFSFIVMIVPIITSIAQ